MTIYISTIILLFLFSLLEVVFKIKHKHLISLRYFSYIFLVFQVGLRWETGTDWNPYLNHFQKMPLDFNGNYMGFEFGYNLIVFLIKLILDEYTLFLMFHSIVFHFFIFKGFNFLSNYFFPCLLMYYVLLIGLEGSNRQLIAICLCLYSLKFLIKKNNKYFFLLITVAFFFHQTAILFLVYYFLNRKINTFVFFSILFFSIFIGLSSLPLTLFGVLGEKLSGVSADKAEFYLESANKMMSENSLSIFGLVKRFLLLFLFYINSKKISKWVPFYNLIFNGYFIGVLIYCLFSSSLIILVNRGSLYFNIMEPILISYLIFMVPKKLFSIYFFIIFIMSFFFFFRSVRVYDDLFIPYKGIFINSSYNRVMY